MSKLRTEERAIVEIWGYKALQNKQHYLGILSEANQIRRQYGNKMPFDDCLWEAEQRANNRKEE